MHKGQMLALLWNETNIRNGLKHKIVDLFLFTQLISIYKKSQDYKSKDWGWLRDFGNFIASSKTKTIGGLYHLNRNH